MTMTLEQVRDCLRAAQNHGLCVVTSHEAKQLADAIDAHLAAVREVIASHRHEIKLCNKHDQESIDYLTEQTDKLEAAIKGAV